MRIRELIYSLGILLLLLIGSCGREHETEDFLDAAMRTPSGFTRTDESGIILQDEQGNKLIDRDDWRTAPIFSGLILFNPAFPNPVYDELVTLQMIVTATGTETGTYELRSRLAGGILLDVVEDAGLPAVYSFVFSASALAGDDGMDTILGLNRLFVLDEAGELVTYGDLSIEAPGVLPHQD